MVLMVYRVLLFKCYGIPEHINKEINFYNISKNLNSVRGYMAKNKRLEKEQITTASIKKLINALQSGTINYEQYQQKLQIQLDKMSEANKAYLSQYVTHRKVVLELLRFVLQSENFG